MNPPSTKQECFTDVTFFEPVIKMLNYYELRRWSVKLLSGLWGETEKISARKLRITSIHQQKPLLGGKKKIETYLRKMLLSEE